MFASKHLDDFENVKKAIEKQIEAAHKPNQQVAAPVSEADELAKFAKLRDDGIISPDEFEAKKKAILGL